MRIKLHNSIIKYCRNTFLFQNETAICKANNELLLVLTIHDDQFFLSFELESKTFHKQSGFGQPSDGRKFYWWESETYRWKDLQS